MVPLFQELGFDHIDDFLYRMVREQCERCSPGRAVMVSLGAGNGEVELPLAARLAEDGLDNLELILLELNPEMLRRALETADALGLADRVRAEAVDLNSWTAPGPVDIFLAIHSLHHIVDLERLYDEVRSAMTDHGVLLVNDMIGRNGHVRWPEAAEVVHRLWATVPPRFHLSHYTGQSDDLYPDHDCSGEGFEGIRAEEVLPLLLERLHPEVYLTFGNVADPFIDRVYGPNFDLSRPEDVALLDAISRLDDALIDLGLITPTHLVGSFRKYPATVRYPRMRSPERTVHPPLAPGPPVPEPEAEAAQPEPETAVSVPEADEASVRLPTADVEAEAAFWRSQYAELRRRRIVRLGLRATAAWHRLRS